MNEIRKATVEDASRIAEILVFTKRMNYRRIFQNDQVSFGEIQVYPLAKEYIDHPEELENIWVYDDMFVKGLIHIEGERIQELYVDTFFQNESIGSKMLDFACEQMKCTFLWALEKNEGALRFYQRHGFKLTGEKELEEGTPEYLVKLEKSC